METRLALAPGARSAIMLGGTVCAVLIGPVGLWSTETDAEDRASLILRGLAADAGTIVFAGVALLVGSCCFVLLSRFSSGVASAVISVTT